MSARDVDLIVTLVLLGLVLFVAWPAAVIDAHRCNRRSEEGRRDLEAAARRWMDANR